MLRSRTTLEAAMAYYGDIVFKRAADLSDTPTAAGQYAFNCVVAPVP